MSTQTAAADTLDFMFDRAAETMPRNELKALQLSRLKTTLERAYNKVPHYKKKFDAAGVKPGDLKSLADLARFPFTVKTDLRDNYPFGMFAVPREQLLRLHASSGTTGKPTVVGYTKADLDLWADLMARCFACASARGPATSCTTPTATACSPAASARITAPSGSAAPWCRCRAAAPSGR